MGRFSKRKTCAVCGNTDDVVWYRTWNTETERYEAICTGCYGKCRFKDKSADITLSAAEIKDRIRRIEETSAALAAFAATNIIGKILWANDETRRWCICEDSYYAEEIPRFYDYADIVAYELLEDGVSVTKGGLGRAVVGGVLFGGVGAVVGGVTGSKHTKNICNKLEIKITLSNLSNPTVYITFIDEESSCKKDSEEFKSAYARAQECLSALQIMTDKNDAPPAVTATSNVDEILKYKNLLDVGAIAQDEYDAKKKQLLGL